MKKLLLLLCLPLLGFGQNTLLVPLQYSTIQNAINASSNNDTVLVSPDTYYENINFNGKNIFLTSYYHTTLDTSFISSTIIDGQNSGNVVRVENNEDTTCVLNGFTITHGNQSGSGAGGGIYISNSDPSLPALIHGEVA